MIFNKSEYLLVKRFLFSKKSDGFISIFSWFSIIGISIGVAAIIIVMSVMNGFRDEFTKRLLGIKGHLNIFSKTNEIDNNNFIKLYENNFDFILTPTTQTQALLITENDSKAVILKGYNNLYINSEHFLKKNIFQGRIFENNINEIVIGYALANKFKLKIDDNIRIAIPKTDKTLFGSIPRFKTLKIVGIFNLGMYEYDLNFVFTHHEIANKLLMIKKDSFNLVEVFTNTPNNIEIIQEKINSLIDKNNLNFYTTSWKENNLSLINALKVEKNVMFFILTLIIIVASMNIISGLIIFVKEKNKDIGILKTIGLSNGSLIKVFLSIGLVIGLTGTFLGGIFGVLFSLNIKKIQLFLEYIFNTELFSREVYYLSNLPSKLDFFEVTYVLLISVFISLAATTFPAIRSIKIDPIKSLKNE